MFHISIGWGAGPNVQKRAQRLLNEAKHELLDSEKMVEGCTAQRDALRARVARLELLCQPAPTNQADGVAKGDITLQTPDARSGFGRTHSVEHIRLKQKRNCVTSS